MADYDCYPLWVQESGGESNVDPADLGLPAELGSALLVWADDFDATLDREDPISSGFASPEELAAFNVRGRELADATAAALGPAYRVSFAEAR